jgi:hypothetical protein
MKINKQSLRQIIKEELQNVLEQDELGGDTLAGKTLAPGDPGYEELQGNNPSRDELGGDTLAGKTIAQDTLAGKTTGVDKPQQDIKQMATKYAKVKQILAKLVSEL